MIEQKAEKDFPWYIRLVFAYQKRKYGQILAPMWAWGRQPALMFVFLFLIGRFQRIEGVTGVLRTLLSVRISQINHCSFCVDFNAYNFLDAHGASIKVENVDHWRGVAECYSPLEQAALAFAEAVTNNDEAATRDALKALQAFFSDDQIVALTAWIGVQNFSSKFNSALGIQTQGFCRLPVNDGHAPSPRP